ncbi:MAG TPA: DinB family protein [Gemmatimonadales bacterium]|jgi:hypothetical protein
MSNPTAADSHTAIASQNAITAWKQNVAEVDAVLKALDDAGLQRTVAADRNRVYYLVGHLVAVHDRIFPLLRLGARKYAALDEEFITQRDNAGSKSGTTAADLRTAWTDVNSRLAAAFDALQPAEWFERHDNVSPEGFAKEPQRNRLAVLLSRTNHMAMHVGQMRLALPRG